MIPPIIFFLVDKEIYFLFPLTIIPFLPFLILDVFIWREFYVKSPVWKKLKYIPSIISVITLIVIYFLFNTKAEILEQIKEDNLIGFIFYRLFALVGLFVIAKMFITDLLFIIINRTKTVEKIKVSGRIDRIERSYESKMLVYRVRLQSSEKIRVNLIGLFYLHFFVKNQQVEFEFNKGILGFEYCSKLPKIVKEK